MGKLAREPMRCNVKMEGTTPLDLDNSEVGKVRDYAFDAPDCFFPVASEQLAVLHVLAVGERE
jgi:hypothetical protein